MVLCTFKLYLANNYGRLGVDFDPNQVGRFLAAVDIQSMKRCKAFVVSGRPRMFLQTSLSQVMVLKNAQRILE